MILYVSSNFLMALTISYVFDGMAGADGVLYHRVLYFINALAKSKWYFQAAKYCGLNA